MLATQTPRLEPALSRRSIVSATLRGLALFAIISILVCLPAFHTATNLHRGGEVVDVFDLGVNAPESSKGGLGVIVVGAFLFTAVHSKNTARVRDHLVTARLGSLRLPSRRRTRLSHLSRRPSESSGSSDDDATPCSSCSMRGMALTPWNPVNARGTRGFFFARESTRDPRYDRHRRQGVVHAIQT